LIDYEKLQGLLGAGSYDQLRTSHKGWVEEHLGDGAKERQDEWTGSVAVGSKPFIESVKASLGFRAKGRDVIESAEGNQLRESPAPYNALFEAENEDIAYISYAQDILFLFQAILIKKSVMYLQTTTIDHVNFYRPNAVPQPTRRLFYADR